MSMIKRMFQLNLKAKEVVWCKRVLAVVMLPIFMFYMTSMNFLIMGMMQAGAEEEMAVEVPASEESVDLSKYKDALDKVDEDDYTTKSREAYQDVVKENKVDEEDSQDDIDEATENILDAQKDLVEVADMSDYKKVLAEVDEEDYTEESWKTYQDVVDENKVTEQNSQDEVDEAVKNIKDAQDGLVKAEEEIEVSIEASIDEEETEAGEEDSEEEVPLSWAEQAEKDGYEIIKVKVGEEYEYKNSGLFIRFVEIDESVSAEDRMIGIKEVKLSEKQVADLGALSKIAYDIISPMKDETFKYDLTLPKPDNVDDVQIKYAGNEDELDEAKTIDEDKTEVKDEEVKAEGIDHFTIYLITFIKSEADPRIIIGPHIYKQGETVSVKEDGLLGFGYCDWRGFDCNWKDYYYRLAVDAPGSGGVYPIGDCVKGGTSSMLASYSLLTPNNITPGDWKVELYQYKKSDCSGSETPYSDWFWQAFEVKANPGSITIIKNAEPSDSQDFKFNNNITQPFLLDDDDDSTLSDKKIFTGLEAGKNYNFTEDASAQGWELDKIECSGTTGYTITNRKVDITLSPGENAVCTFFNVKDSDNDGISDSVDNCVNNPNPLQENLDGDEFGDVCDDQTCGNKIKEGTEQCDGEEYCNKTCEIIRSAEITEPDVPSLPAGTINFGAFLVDDDADPIQWAIRKDSCAANTNTIFGNVDGHNDVAIIDTTDFSNQTFSFSTSMTPGNYCFVYNPSEDSGESDIRLTKEFEIVDNEKPVVNLVEPTIGSFNPTQIIVEATDETSLYRVTANIYNETNSTLLYPCSKLAGGSKTDTLTCPIPGDLADGVYTIRANAQDNASPMHTASTITRQFTIDNTAPAIPTGLKRIAPNEDGKIYECNAVSKIQRMWPDWNDNEEGDLAHYEYSSFNPGVQGIDEQEFTDSIFEYNGSWLPGEGTYGFAVRAVDKAGNKSGWALSGETLEGSCKITYDSTPPSAPTLISPANNAIVNGNPQQSWSLVSDADHYVYESWYDTDTTNPANFIWSENNLKTTSRTVGGMQTITFYWHVKAVDVAGNESAWSEWRKLAVDNTAPIVEITSPLEGSYLKGTVNIYGSIIESIAMGNYNIAIYPGGANFMDFSQRLEQKDVNPATAFINQNIYQWDTTKYADGEYLIRFAARDKVGNRNLASGQEYTGGDDSQHVIKVIVDNTDPTSAITFPANSGADSVIYINDWTGELSGTSADNLSGVNKVQVSIQRGSDGKYLDASQNWVDSPTELLVDATGTNPWSYSGPTTLLEDEYTIKSHAVDNAGNVEDTYSLTIVFDKTIPEVDLEIDPRNPTGDNDWYRSHPEITLTATDINFDKIEYEIGSGSWKIYSSPVEIDDGAYVFYYRAIDKAGNVSDVGRKNVKVDTKDPDEVSNVDAEYNEANDSVKLTWDADDDDISEVAIYKGDSKSFGVDNGSRIAELDDSDEGYTDNDVDRGNKYYYKFVSKDEAGNKSGAKVISVDIPEGGGAAIVTDEGTEVLPEEPIVEEQTGFNEEGNNGEGGNGGQVAGAGAINENPPSGGIPRWLYFGAGIPLALFGLWFWLVKLGGGAIIE